MKKSDVYFLTANLFCVGTFASKHLFGVIFCAIACVFYAGFYVYQSKQEGDL